MTPWNEADTALNYVLARLYPFERESYRIVDEAGLPAYMISYSPRGIDNWHAIILEAKKRKKVPDLVRAALKDYPDDPILTQASKGELQEIPAAPKIDENIPWKADLKPENLEKIMGKQSTLLPINFLELGMQRSQSVARVYFPNDGESGTGFLLPDNIFVTNNHVIQNEAQARDSVVQFNYQKSPRGLDAKTVELHFAPENGFATSAEYDYTFVKMREDANQDWGAIKIEKVDIRPEQHVNIIQHPDGIS